MVSVDFVMLVMAEEKLVCLPNLVVLSLFVIILIMEVNKQRKALLYPIYLSESINLGANLPQ